jgi:hypothetical protein
MKPVDFKLLSTLELVCEGKDCASVMGAASLVLVAAAQDAGMPADELFDILGDTWDAVKAARSANPDVNELPPDGCTVN